MGSAGAPRGDLAPVRAAGPVQVKNAISNSGFIGGSDARSSGLRGARKPVDADRCRRAGYMQCTAGERPVSAAQPLFPRPVFFSHPPETTPEGGEANRNPNGTKPLVPGPSLSSVAWWARSVDGAAPHEGAFPTDTTRGLRLSVCVVCPKIRRVGNVGTLGVDSVEVATRATHCTLTLSLLSCPEHPTPPAQGPSTRPPAQDPAGASIHQSSGTLRDSPAVASSDVKPTFPLADDVACTLHHRPQPAASTQPRREFPFLRRRQPQISAKTSLLAQSLTTRNITEQQDLITSTISEISPPLPV